MKSFLRRFALLVAGVLHGFDRLRFRGSKRQLCHTSGLLSWLGAMGLRLKDYKGWARDTTVSLCRAIESRAEADGLYCFLNNSTDSKEETARRLAKERQRTQGLVAVIGCVEPCRIMQVRGNRASKQLEVRAESGKCKHYYHYYLDPEYGLRYTRLQTWLPLTMHVGLNGREWLAKQMDRAGIAYRQRDNCFPWIADFAAAQRLAARQLTTAWPGLLDRWARQSDPLAATLLKLPVPYYWSVEAAEYATDIAFAAGPELQRWYPQFVRHALTVLQSTDVLRFMGYRLRGDGRPWQDWPGEATTRLKEWVEGLCVKHQAHGNLVKMYDKFGEVLRVESLLHDVREFKVYRTLENDPDGPMAYRRLRQGVADLQRRAVLSQKINERYAASLATTAEPAPLAELTAALGRRQEYRGRWVRALNPLAPADGALLEAVGRGEHLLSGFRNRDIRVLLYGAAPSADEEKRQAARVTRQLRLLAGHGLIARIPKTHRYQLTDHGRKCVTVLLAARKANAAELLAA
jgi:hypothetical protein